MITQAELQQILHYDPLTGLFTWKKKISHKVVIGSIAGSFNNKYKEISIFKERHKSHRLAWLYVHGILPPKPNMIDHINGIKHDNRLINLRVATPAQNAHNAKLRSDNTSGCKGVSFNKRTEKFVANICINNEQLFLGLFDTLEEADKRYKEEADKLHKEFARY